MCVRFLDDESLGGAIAELLQGNNVCCSVAFWGTGAVERLFPGRGVPQNARIVCDLSIGSTNPDELRVMGAPTNDCLRHCERLHAKVYISDRGAIVCSANASDNGIGFVGAAGLVEAGVFLESDSDAFDKVVDWFEQIWERSSPIDGPALKRATEAWNRRPRGPIAGRALPIPRDAASLLGAVAADPERFRGIGFVFTSGRAREGEREKAADELQRRDNARQVPLLSQQERQRLRSWNIGDLFTEWSEQDLDAWPRRFVCIHLARIRFSYWFYERAHEVLLGEDRGVVFAERPVGLRLQLGFTHGKEAMLETDGPLLKCIYEKCEEHDRWLFESGERLMRFIEEIPGI